MTTAFLNNDRVQKAVNQVKVFCHGREFSDIVDLEGHQYVDFVMEGGGVLGIALTGYTYILEQADIRFLGIAGTSAGSINALLLAALGPPDRAKSKDLVKVLAGMPMDSFIDGDSDAQDFSQAMLEKVGLSKLLWKGAQVIDNLQEDLGLNPGEAFLNWLSEELKERGITTMGNLLEVIKTNPDSRKIRPERLKHDDLGPIPDLSCKLVMIAADITTGTKVRFPEMAHLYWEKPESTVDPACFARASMSIPFFFHPFKVSNIPQDPQPWLKIGKDKAITLPQNVMFMDGGIMSNFPINVFHQPYRVPAAPTFGAKIGVDNSYREITRPSQLLGSVFDAARHTLDDDFIGQNPDYRLLVKEIDTEPHHWLNFSMAESEKVDLFARGAEAAADFLCNFDWHQYKKVRQGIAEAYRQSKPQTEETAMLSRETNAQLSRPGAALKETIPGRM